MSGPNWGVCYITVGFIIFIVLVFTNSDWVEEDGFFAFLIGWPIFLLIMLLSWTQPHLHQLLRKR